MEHLHAWLKLASVLLRSVSRIVGIVVALLVRIDFLILEFKFP